jgi:hypothetical protein
MVDDDSYGNCQVFCDCEHEPFIQRWATHKSEAIAAWNRRSAPPPERGEVESLLKEMAGALEDALPFILDVDLEATWIDGGPRLTRADIGRMCSTVLAKAKANRGEVDHE